MLNLIKRCTRQESLEEYCKLKISMDFRISEPTLELHSRAASSVDGLDTGSNSGGRQIIKKMYANISMYLLALHVHGLCLTTPCDSALLIAFLCVENC